MHLYASGVATEHDSAIMPKQLIFRLFLLPGSCAPRILQISVNVIPPREAPAGDVLTGTPLVYIFDVRFVRSPDMRGFVHVGAIPGYVMCLSKCLGCLRREGACPVDPYSELLSRIADMQQRTWADAFEYATLSDNPRDAYVVRGHLVLIPRGYWVKTSDGQTCYSCDFHVTREEAEKCIDPDREAPYAVPLRGRDWLASSRVSFRVCSEPLAFFRTSDPVAYVFPVTAE